MKSTLLYKKNIYPHWQTSNCEGEYEVILVLQLCGSLKRLICPINKYILLTFFTNNNALAVTRNHASIVHTKDIKEHYHYITEVLCPRKK